MPVLKLCSHAGCTAKTENARCPNHTFKRQYKERKDKQFQSFYQTPAWKRLRNIKKAKEPLCMWCLKEGKTTQSDHTDHWHEIKDGGEKLNIDNLVRLCAAHHSMKTHEVKYIRNHGKPSDMRNYLIANAPTQQLKNYLLTEVFSNE